jgi:hypothetical protein
MKYPLSFYSLTSLLSLSILLPFARCFWDFGHIYLPRIAYDELQKTEQGRIAVDRANSLLGVYTRARPEMTPSEKFMPFVECGRFADEIREDPAKDGNWQFFWHFVDTGFFDQGGSYPDYPNFKKEVESIDKAIPYIINWLID